MSLAERNNDIGNRELLALEEWRHWLEGANHPFEVITDHRNLEYLREANRLNPRQAHWALFLTRFNFNVTYRPGSKNLKADILSHLHNLSSEDLLSKPILSPAMFISPIIWDLDEQITQENLLHPAPPEVPENLIFIPKHLRNELLDSAHSTPGSGHLGNRRTLSLLSQQDWWLSISQDVSQHVIGCSVCAITIPLEDYSWANLYLFPYHNSLGLT